MSEIVTVRDLAMVTSDIQYAQRQGARQLASNLIEIGRLLVEAKTMVEPKNWDKYIWDNFGYSTSSADNWMKLYREYKAEHHMNAQKQRMKVPIECGPVQKLDMVGRCDTSKGFHGLLEKLSAVLVQRVIVVKESCRQVEGPVLELPGNPIVGLGVLTLEAHVLCHGLVSKSHCQGHLCSVFGNAPAGFYPLLDQIKLFKGKEQRKIVLCGHGFCSNKVILWKIDRLILHILQTSSRIRESCLPDQLVQMVILSGIPFRIH